jgi:ParB family chromosome partitioning protein
MEETRVSDFHNNAVFFIEVDKIHPNPYQPRREFDESRLQELAESIRMYGVLQPLVVTRKEITKPDGGIATEYELIAGERRTRASKLAGLREVPALIRAKEDDDKTKLELAIIENLQREDLNPIDRARAFADLHEKFGFKHSAIAKKVGKSREYVSNSIRMLALPEEMLEALSNRKISEGHARPLLMLGDRPEEQNVLFREILLKKMTVRDAEKISRKIAYDKVRKPERMFDPDIVEMEEVASQRLGTRVMIESKEKGGRIKIDYFSDEDLKKILAVLSSEQQAVIVNEISGNVAESEKTAEEKIAEATPLESISEVEKLSEDIEPGEEMEHEEIQTDDEEDDDIYAVQNFSI